MALRDIRTGHLLAFRACADELADDRFAMVEARSESTWTGRLDGVCPVHHADRCVETYLPVSRVASWSLRTFWSWRRNQRAGGSL